MKKRLENKIRAGYGIISIDTTEETRTLSILKEIAISVEENLYQWSITSGLTCLSNGKDREQIDDPIDLIKRIVSSHDDAIFVMLDPSPFLKDPVFLRTLKDHIKDFESGKTLILLGTGIDIPIELKHLVSAISSPLPTKDELRKVVTEISCTNEKEVDDDKMEKTIEALAGLTFDQSANAVAESIVETGDIDPAVISREKCRELSSKDYLKVETEIPDITDVGGLDELKSWLDKRKRCFSKEAIDFGLPIPKGFLMVGLPGCGKSLVSKCTSSILEIPLIKFDIGALMGSLVGESEKNVRDAIEIAESMAPCVLWIDELDKQLSPSGGTADGGHEVTKRIMSSLLTWMSDKKSPIFIVATANNIQGLSNSFPELLRKGRWDETFFVDLPNPDEREEIFRIHIKKTKRDVSKFDVSHLSEISNDFTGAEIESAVRDAMYIAFDNNVDLGMESIESAVGAIIPQARHNMTIKHLREWADGKARRATRIEKEVKSRKIKT